MDIIPTERIAHSPTPVPALEDSDSEEDPDASPAASAEKIRRLKVCLPNQSSDKYRMNSVNSKGKSKPNPQLNRPFST